MVHTLSPWASRYKIDKIYTDVDNHELVARLNSSSSHDRRGKMQWYDNMEGSTIKWWDGSDAGGSISLSDEYAFRGDHSLYFITDNDVDDEAESTRYFAYPITDTLGFEMSFSALTHQSEVDFFIDLDNGTNLATIQHRIDIPNKQLSIYDSTGAFVVYETLSNNIMREYNGFNIIKLVFDMSTLTFVRSIFNNVEYDLSSYNLRSGATIGNYWIDFRIRLRTKAAAQAKMWVDNVMFTIFEE